MPKNISELRHELSQVFAELRAGTLSPNDAKEINNAAGKIIGTCKVQIAYAELREEKPRIDFLEVPCEPAPKNEN